MHVKEDYAVIVIDNSDLAKPASRKLEALSEIRDGSTGKITQGYLRSLSENFNGKCVRTLDRSFDADDYFRYLLKRGCINFRDKSGKTKNLSCIPVRLCEFPAKELTLVAAKPV